MIDYKGKKLTCTQEELTEFISKIEKKTSVHGFNEKYNGVTVENNTGDDSAVYIVIEIGGSKILQPFLPNSEGYKPISRDEANKVIENIVNDYIDQLVFSTFEEKPKTKEELLEGRILDLEKTIAEMSMLMAMPAG